MKHTMKLLAAAALAALSLDAAAQKNAASDPEGYVTYSLPQTAITIEVEAVQESFHAGPYAKFAEKYLGIKARQKDETVYRISEVKMIPYVEADQSRRYVLPVKGGGADAALLKLSSAGLVSFSDGRFGQDAAWRFPMQGKGDFSGIGISSNLTSASTTLYMNDRKSSETVSVKQNVVVEKSAEKKAAETAGMIFKMREQRLKIITGDTDANYSGEAMSAALNELTRLENEYMTLFLGYSETGVQRKSFEVIPEAGRSNQMYVAFRISDAAGLVTADNLSGKPVILEIAVPQIGQVELPDPDSKQAKKQAKVKNDAVLVHYSIPAMCTVKLLDGADVLIQDRIPVYQLGQESTIPADMTIN